MRLRVGRPDLARYAGRLTLGPAGPAGPLTVTFLGVSTLLLDDGESALLTDGFFTRPGLARVGLGPVRPSPSRIDACLARAGIERLAAVLPVHSHYDHALDAPSVAERTGALLVGGRSTCRIGAGHGLPPERLREVTAGQEVALGAYRVTFLASRHCPPDRFPGEIPAPVPRSARVSAYRCGQAWSLLVGHPPSGRRLLIQGSAGFVPGALSGQRAEVAYLGVGQLGHRPVPEIEEYWVQTVRAVGARRAVLIHWDDFFRPLSAPLRALPYVADDLDVTMRVLGRLADADGVDLVLPAAFVRADPWA